MCDDVRLKDLNKYKEMIKREGNEVVVFLPEEVLKEKNERTIIYRTCSSETRKVETAV